MCNRDWQLFNNGKCRKAKKAVQIQEYTQQEKTDNMPGRDEMSSWSYRVRVHHPSKGVILLWKPLADTAAEGQAYKQEKWRGSCFYNQMWVFNLSILVSHLQYTGNTTANLTNRNSKEIKIIETDKLLQSRASHRYLRVRQSLRLTISPPQFRSR